VTNPGSGLLGAYRQRAWAGASKANPELCALKERKTVTTAGTAKNKESPSHFLDKRKSG
jgi:hypothetical protein